MSSLLTLQHDAVKVYAQEPYNWVKKVQEKKPLMISEVSVCSCLGVHSELFWAVG